MHLELAQLQHYVVTPEKQLGSEHIVLPPDREPEALPWQRPIDLRLRAALRLGVLLCFLLAGVLLILIRAAGVTSEAQAQARMEARTLAASAALPLARYHTNAAQNILDALGEKQDVVGAALYDSKGKRFADYAVSHSALLQLPRPGADVLYVSEFWSRTFPGALVIWEPVKTKWESVGWLVIEVDLRSRWRAFFSELSWMGAALLAMLLLCAGVVSRLQQRMAEPLYRLARTSKVIVEDRDYTLRAWKDARDEIGSVADCFNHLLDEIQRRAKALVDARSELALAIHMREEALAKVNQTDNETQRQRKQFLANMCHEIRTPMNRVVATGKQLAATALSERQQDLLSAMRGSSELVITLADDVLDYTRIESGKLALQDSEFDPSEIGEAVVRMYKERAQAKQIALSAHCAHPLPALVRGDCSRLRQVIGSLVGNAIKFSQGGELRIHLSTGKREADRIELSVHVHDSGFGIAGEARTRIYQSFLHGQNNPTAPSGSAGLGLSIAQHLVRRMGGELRLDEHSGVSSGFHFGAWVQEIRGARDLTPAKVSAEPVSQAPKAQRLALIFDEGGSQRKSLRQVLQKLGFEVETAGDPGELRERCAHHRFDVLFASAKCLQALGNALASVLFSQPAPVVAMFQRGHDDTHTLKVSDRLAYPFRRKEVEEVLARQLSVAPSRASEAREKQVAPVTKAVPNDPWMAQVVEVYLDSTPDLIEQLISALRRGDTQQACEAARTLGACSAKVGATHFATLCQRIESGTHAGNLPAAPQLFEELGHAYAEAKAALEKGIILAGVPETGFSAKRGTLAAHA